jgi:hypothetical protein
MSGINAEHPDSESPDPLIAVLVRDEPDDEEDDEEDKGDSKEDGDDDENDDGYSE